MKTDCAADQIGCTCHTAKHLMDELGLHRPGNGEDLVRRALRALVNAAAEMPEGSASAGKAFGHAQEARW